MNGKTFSFAVAIIIGLVIMLIAAFIPEWSFWIFAYPKSVFISAAIAIILGLLFGGKAFTDNYFGALIDGRKKVSVSRFQMILWTIVVLSSVYAIAVNNVRFLDNPPEEAVVSDGETKDPLDIHIPDILLVLMGLSASAAVGSTLIKKQQKEDDAIEPLTVNTTKEEAKFSDMFKNEFDPENIRLDLTKIQMFYATIVLVIAYLYSILIDLDGNAFIDGMPEISAGLVGLLTVSHGTYLVSKSVSSPKKKQAGGNGEN